MTNTKAHLVFNLDELVTSVKSLNTLYDTFWHMSKFLWLNFVNLSIKDIISYTWELTNSYINFHVQKFQQYL